MRSYLLTLVYIRSLDNQRPLETMDLNALRDRALSRSATFLAIDKAYGKASQSNSLKRPATQLSPVNIPTISSNKQKLAGSSSSQTQNSIYTSTASEIPQAAPVISDASNTNSGFIGALYEILGRKKDDRKFIKVHKQLENSFKSRSIIVDNAAAKAAASTSRAKGKRQVHYTCRYVKLYMSLLRKIHYIYLLFSSM